MDAQVVVVGGGVMGAATAWRLARSGVEVVLLERFGPGHHEGASHGETRNFNTAYASAHYLDLVLRARALWAELAQESGRTVLDEVGLVNHGGGERRWGAVRDALRARGEEAPWLPATEAGSRWPTLRFESTGRTGRDVLWVPRGARVRAAVAWEAMLAAARGHGADVRHEVPVAAIERVGGGVRITTSDGATLDAATAVVTAGAWTRALAGHLVPLPELTVTQEQPAHFVALSPEGEGIPGFNHAADPERRADDYFRSDVYGMATPGEGIKAGWHGTGPVVDPDARTSAPEPEQLADLRRYASEWLPGVDAQACTPISCTYTSTRTTDFVLDRERGVVVGAGFSGHGYKFAPAVGEVLARLATGGERAAEPFRLGAADAARAADGAPARRGFGT